MDNSEYKIVPRPTTGVKTSQNVKQSDETTHTSKVKNIQPINSNKRRTTKNLTTTKSQRLYKDLLSKSLFSNLKVLEPKYPKTNKKNKLSAQQTQNDHKKLDIETALIRSFEEFFKSSKKSISKSLANPVAQVTFTYKDKSYKYNIDLKKTPLLNLICAQNNNDMDIDILNGYLSQIAHIVDPPKTFLTIPSKSFFFNTKENLFTNLNTIINSQTNKNSINQKNKTKITIKSEFHKLHKIKITKISLNEDQPEESEA